MGFKELNTSKESFVTKVTILDGWSKALLELDLFCVVILKIVTLPSTKITGEVKFIVADFKYLGVLSFASRNLA
jgi:hypothetical protein